MSHTNFSHKLQPFKQAGWNKASSIKLFPKIHSEAMNIHRLLLAMPRYGDHPPSVTIGWYFGGLMNVWRIDGSPSDQHPTHWMLIPELPE